MPAPFIVTAELPGAILSWADGLRREHYPPHRNKLRAHVTLFHSLAPSLCEELPRELARFAGAYRPPSARITGLMDLDGGTALLIHSPQLQAIRSVLAERFAAMLTAQDRGVKKLHITIQNKVDRPAARALQCSLQGQLREEEFHFTGLGLHLYQETHWDCLKTWSFRGKEHA